MTHLYEDAKMHLIDGKQFTCTLNIEHAMPMDWLCSTFKILKKPFQPVYVTDGVINDYIIAK